MSLYLSQLILNPRSRQVQAELRDPYQMHRTFSKAFGDGEGEYKSARCLFRVDESADGRTLKALVQSRVEPDWDRLTASEGYFAGDPMVKEFSTDVPEGRLLQFRLRANPAVKRDGKRVGIYKEAERLEWIRRKAEDNGFRILDARVASDGKQHGTTRENLATVHAAAVFEGVLEVTDVDRFSTALESGIGSAKGFGFGLLSIAPLRR